MRSFCRSLGAGLLATVLALPLGMASAASENLSGKNLIADCLSKMDEPRLAVQFLIDESRSLNDSDPLDKRVDAMNTALAALSFNLISPDESKEEQKLTIDVRLVGFAKKFESHDSKWVQLDNDDNSSLYAAAAEFKSRDQVGYTNYQAGLEGAEESFVEYDRAHDGDKACKVLVWLTDGNLDLDNSSSNTKPEDRQKKQMCGDGGVVDRLRSQQVFVIGLGLNSNSEKKQDFSLMSKMVDGGCGKREPVGRFTEVGVADDLIQEMFRNLLPGVIDPLVPCLGDEQNENCREVRFTVRSPLSRINVLVGLTPEIDTAAVLNPKNEQVLFATNGKTTEVNQDFLIAKPSFDLSTILNIDVHDNVSDKTGVWRIQFNGIGAKKALVMSVFFSDVQIEIASMPIRIDRRNPEPVVVSLRNLGLDGLENVDSPADIAEVDSSLTLVAELSLGSALIKGVVTPWSTDTSHFGIQFPSSQLEKAPSNGVLTITPVANISGHEVNFASRTADVRLKIGNGFPTIRKVSSSNIDGNSTSKVVIAFDGPEEGVGAARILTSEFRPSEVPAGAEGKPVEITGLSDKKISVPAGKSEEVEFSIDPSYSANGKFKGEVKIEFTNSLNERDQQTVAFEFDMTKPFDKEKFLWALLVMLASFVVIQGLILFFAADRLSRISKVPEETYYARFRARINPSGLLEPVNPNNWENVFKFGTNPVMRSVSGKRRAGFGEFVVFGTRMNGLKWLFAGADSSLSVEWPGNTVVGSRSDKSASTKGGKVLANLSGEWALAVSQTDAIRLAQNSSESDTPAGTYTDHLTGELREFEKDISVEAEFIYFVANFDGEAAGALLENMVSDLSASPLRELIAAAGQVPSPTVGSVPVEPTADGTMPPIISPTRSRVEEDYG